MSHARAFLKRHPSFWAYILIVGVFEFGQHSREVDQCHSSRDGRTVLRTVIEKSFTDNGTGDLTQVPGFADLDAPTQTYFRNLVVLSQQNGGSAGLKQALLDKVPIPSCG